MRPGRALWRAAAVLVVTEAVWCSVALASGNFQEADTSLYTTTNTGTLEWWEDGSRRHTEQTQHTRHDEGTREEQDINVLDLPDVLIPASHMQHIQENMVDNRQMGGEDKRSHYQEGRRLEENTKENEVEVEEEMNEEGRLFFTGLTGLTGNQQVTISVDGLWAAIMWIVFMVVLIKLLIYVITGKSYTYWGRWLTSAFGDDYYYNNPYHSTYTAYRAFDNHAKKYN
ncbi:uncharacterized protein LOC123505825 [Portunus trituberculatus]|uniref:uncharacterized protein LOC123505825 n=1 Tax=Portunus trituberculatus TaxID=210409 RepID=UPI001E1CE72C|nr:uncharacterized protein LOC123505825 [Portunus trituberculatus]